MNNRLRKLLMRYFWIYLWFTLCVIMLAISFNNLKQSYVKGYRDGINDCHESIIQTIKNK